MGAHSTTEEPRTLSEGSWPASTYAYPRGVALFPQGQILQEVLQVVSGVVKLTQSDAAGAESIVGLAVAGEWVGTAAVIADKPTPVSAIVCSDAVLRRVPASTLRQLLRQDPQLSLQIHQAHSRELCSQVTRIGQMCLLDAVRRLQCALCRFAATLGRPASDDAVRLQLPLQNWELAQFIGVTPEHLSRLLKHMEHEGLIRREKGWIVIPGPKRLCQDDDE